MENVGQVPSSGSSLSTFSNSDASLYGSEVVKYPFRLNVVVTPNADPAGGFISFTLPIDSLLQDKFLTGFEFFTYEELTLDMQCTAPLGTASGAVQVGYFADALNATMPATLAEAKNKIGSTDGWVMIRPRDSKSLRIPVDTNPMFSGWRFVRIDQANPRMSSFGTVVGITAEPPAAGDGTVYEAWLHGWAVGRRRTENIGVDSSYLRFRSVWNAHTPIWDYGVGCPKIQFYVKCAVPDDPNATIVFDRAINVIAAVETGSGTDVHPIKFELDFSISPIAILDGVITLSLWLTELPARGVSPDHLAFDLNGIPGALSSTYSTIQHSVPNAAAHAYMNQAKFKPRPTMAFRFVDPATHTLSRLASSCTISGRYPSTPQIPQ